MDDNETFNVNGPLATVLRILSVFGIAPLRFSPLRHATKTLRISDIHHQRSHATRNCFIASVSRRRAYLGRILILTILIFQAILTTYRILKTPIKDDKFFYVLAIFYIIISSVTLIVAAFEGINKMKRFISYLNKLEEIHEELKSSYIDQKMTKFNIILWLLLLFPILYCFWLIFYYMNENGVIKEPITINILIMLQLVYNFKQFILLLLVLEFALIVCSVNITLRIQNERLDSLLYKLQLYEAMKIKAEINAHTRIRHLRLTYVSICELVRSINNGEGALLFIVLVCHIYDIIASCYSTMSETTLVATWSYVTIIHVGLTILGFFYKGACLITLIEPCYKTMKEFQKVQVLVSHLMCVSTEKNFKNELSRYYEQCTNNVPTFSPLGICDLTRKFMVQVIGGIVTFLTIVIQFRLVDVLD